MKNIILNSVILGGLAFIQTHPASAQNENGGGAAAENGFTTKNVRYIRPFGLINVYNVGMDLKNISAWVKTLNAGEKLEMVGRCTVIIQNQQTYYGETVNFCQNFAIAMAETLGARSNSK